MFSENRETMRKRLELIKPAEVSDGGQKRWTPGQVLAAYLQWERTQTKASSGGSDIDPEYEKARKDREIADKYALANAERRGELVEASSVEKVWLAQITACKTRLLAIPRKCAPAVVMVTEPTEAEAIIEQEVRDALEALAVDV